MKIFISIISIALLAGCGFTPEGQAVRMAVSEFGAKAADAELENVEWALCNGISVGAFKRRYGQSPDKVKAWQALCASSTIAP